ncbi:MAG: serine hydrolase domain-containing protein [Anaerolineae bacterium]
MNRYQAHAHRRLLLKARSLYLLVSLLISLALAGCGGPSAAELAAIDYAPLAGGDWAVSTPEEQGLDPDLLAQFYYDAAQLESIYGLLVIKNGQLIAEKYFHEGSIDQMSSRASVTKSVTSALIGIALDQGCLESVDQKMMEFFPELAGQIRDPRKEQITIQQLLQMRAGYPWEESSPELMELLFTGFRPSSLVAVPLAYDPGTYMDYSNLTSHILGIIVARACGTDLKSYAQDNLFSPLGGELGFWQQDWEGYYLGFADLDIRARDMAKFGLMYLDGGVYQGQQIVPADWVRDSLQIYSEDAWRFRVGRNWRDPGYGYQWWSIHAGEHRYNLAWGHGGQQIALLEDLNMVIVVTADPLYKQHGDAPWKLEKANLNLMADFVASLPAE